MNIHMSINCTICRFAIVFAMYWWFHECFL